MYWADRNLETKESVRQIGPDQADRQNHIGLVSLVMAQCSKQETSWEVHVGANWSFDRVTDFLNCFCSQFYVGNDIDPPKPAKSTLKIATHLRHVVTCILIVIVVAIIFHE